MNQHKEIELERTFLLKYIPQGLVDCNFKEIIDIYLPKNVEHPVTRLRKIGEKYEITKKEVINGNDSSEQSEKTIPLSETEFEALSKVNGKKLRKNRFYYPCKNLTAEIDFYLDDLAGLVVVDFEFNSREEMEKFKMPEFCLVEVTQDEVIAGGVLAGKSYREIEKYLEKYKYIKNV
jgi:CYTH domain-containing protein